MRRASGLFLAMTPAGRDPAGKTRYLPYPQRGFTLLELMVAMAIFAVISVAVWSGLDTVMNTRQHTEQHADQLAALQTAFTILGRDIEQALDREVRDNFGDKLPALQTGSGTLLDFTRNGWRNPAGRPRSHLQRVAYALVDDELRRYTWSTLDRVQDSEAMESVLLAQVKSVELRFLDSKLDWQTSWPIEDPDPAVILPPLPRAVEFSLEMEGWQPVTRLFAVPG